MGDRPAHSDEVALKEMEVTPLMRLAGAEVLERFYLGDGKYDLRGEVLAEVFQAMFLAMSLPLGPECQTCHEEY